MRSTGAGRLTAEAAFHDTQFYEICKTPPFGRNPTLELVAVLVEINIGPKLQNLERQREVLG